MYNAALSRTPPDGTAPRARPDRAATRATFAAFVAAAIVIAIVGTLAVWSTHRWVRTLVAVEHTHSVIDRTADVRAQIVENELRRRAIVLNRDQLALTAYEQSMTAIDRQLVELAKLARNDATHSLRVEEVRRAVDRRRDLFVAQLDAPPTKEIATGSGPMLTEATGLLDAITFDERKVLAVNVADAFGAEAVTRAAVVGAVLLALVMLTTAFVAVRKAMNLQTAAEDDNAKLARALEDRVKVLDSVNRELESFSYSVAHDLRAPLRSINGFSQVLLEDYGPALDEQAQQHLQRVHKSARRMGELIDDMLALARVTRAEMKREPVDLSALARTVLAETLAGAGDREIDAVVAEDVVVEGDATLLRVVLMNLFENAVKFTSKRPRARIEFGANVEDGVATCFVRDDGAGFDMAYADKLFGTFQRLHAFDEFPGTGIGLATVQRIVHRHGGRVWADGRVNEGAQFHFSLQRPRANC